MNVLITLPKKLIDCIIRGEKTYEMRKSLPRLMRLGEDGFFAVEKGTSNVRCWCRIDSIYGTYIDHYSVSWFVSRLCVDEKFINKYANCRGFLSTKRLPRSRSDISLTFVIFHK